MMNPLDPVAIVAIVVSVAAVAVALAAIAVALALPGKKASPTASGAEAKGK